MKDQKSLEIRLKPYLDFMNSPPFRVAVVMIGLIVIGYCLGHFLLQVLPDRVAERELARAAAHNPKDIALSPKPIASPDSLSDKTITNASDDESVSETDIATPSEQSSTPQWQWEGHATDTNDSINNQAHTAIDNEIYSELDAEASELLKESDSAVAYANEAISQAIPLLIETLETLSVEEQRIFLAEAKARVSDYMPPELKQLDADNPQEDLIENGWKYFLKQLEAHGYELPEGL